MGFLDFFKLNKKSVQLSDIHSEMKSKPVNLLTQISTTNKDLSIPYIDSAVNRGLSYVRFGDDNLYPNVINQLYMRSPMLSQCIEFKVNSVVSAGWIWSNYDNLKVKEITDLKAIDKKIKINILLEDITRNWSKHGRAIVLLRKLNGKYTKAISIDPARVRNSRGKNIFDNTPISYVISDDWVYGGTTLKATPYKETNDDEFQIMELRNMVGGVEDYGIPDWISAANWCNVSGDLALLNKSALQNSVSPGMLYIYPYDFTDVEYESFMRNLELGGKGAMNHSKAQLLNARNVDLKPDVVPVQQADNLSIFKHTSEEQKIEIAMANGINPVLMGLQIPGSLGQNEQILHASNQFKAGWLNKNRNTIQNFMNEILDIFDCSQDLLINETIIFDDKLFIKEGNTVDEKNNGTI